MDEFAVGLNGRKTCVEKSGIKGLTNVGKRDIVNKTNKVVEKQYTRLIISDQSSSSGVIISNLTVVMYFKNESQNRVGDLWDRRI